MNDERMLDYVKERLPAPSEKAELEKIAAAAKVNFHTLLKIANGETEDPRVSTVQTLYDYFKALEARAA